MRRSPAPATTAGPRPSTSAPAAASTPAAGPAFDWLTANAGPVRLGAPARGRNPAGRNPNRGTGNTGQSHELGTATRAPRRSAAWINQGVLFALVLAVAAVVVLRGALGGRLAGRQRRRRRAGRRTGIAVEPGRRAAARRRRHLPAMDSTRRPPRSPATPRSTASTTRRRHPARGSSSTCPSGGRATSTRSAASGRPAAVHARTARWPSRARSCASSRAGQGGDCPAQLLLPAERTPGMVFGAWDYGPGDLDKLNRRPDRGLHPRPEPVGRRQHHRSPWTRRRTCGRRGWRCGTTRTRRPWSSRCWKTAAGLAVWNECAQLQ